MHTLKCPTCGRRVKYNDRSEVPEHPFCSERCRLIDLGKWFDEEYRVISPAENPAPTESPQSPDPDEE